MERAANIAGLFSMGSFVGTRLQASSIGFWTAGTIIGAFGFVAAMEKKPRGPHATFYGARASVHCTP
jgi:hypothetical protein